MTDLHSASTLPYCRNCRYTLSQPRPDFCGHCGQETDLHPPSMHEFIHEYVGHYVALEGPLWRSLWALILLPGRLTREYFAGRRRHYVLPLRIYLTASFLFFVLGHLLPHGQFDAKEFSQARQHGRSAAASAAPPAAAPPSAKPSDNGKDDDSASDWIKTDLDVDMDACRKPDARCGWWQKHMARSLHKLNGLKREDVKSRMSHAAPYAMLVMQPVFALILLLMFAGSGRRYAEHFVFSLHMHAFWFLALLLEQAVSASGALFWAVPLHGLIALRTVYGRGWWANIWRSLIASLFYMLALALGSGALVVLIVQLS